MSTTDPHRYDDAAYVLGALAPDERAAFEAHLATCAECVARVHEIDVVPALLAGIDEADLADLADLADEPMPDTRRRRPDQPDVPLSRSPPARSARPRPSPRRVGAPPSTCGVTISTRASNNRGTTPWSLTTVRVSRTSLATGNCHRTRTSTTRLARR